jgi:galactose-6-phosphate isomerase
MALLNVSSVLDDPAFRDDTLICTRNAQGMAETGLAVNTPSDPIPFSGVVTSGGGDRLIRMADGSRISGSITIYTRFALSAGSPGFDADIVTWQGRQYTVTPVNNWESYGDGFVSVDCDLIPFSG